MLPSLTSPEALADHTVVVIDVLRATTTITHALAAGANEVIPSADIDEARTLAANYAPGEVRLGGERGGVKVEGFDLGNSPAEYNADTVGGRTVVFTTTNGTRAMEFCRQAQTVLIGAFVNLAAVCESLKTAQNIHLLCSGTEQKVTREDVLLAGAIADRLTARSDAPWELNDEARLAAAAWRQVTANLSETSLPEALLDSQGGRNVTRLGLTADIETAGTLDQFDLAPRLDLGEWRILAR